MEEARKGKVHTPRTHIYIYMVYTGRPIYHYHIYIIILYIIFVDDEAAAAGGHETPSSFPADRFYLAAAVGFLYISYATIL